jgi:hypothetical protein
VSDLLQLARQALTLYGATSLELGWMRNFVVQKFCKNLQKILFLPYFVKCQNTLLISKDYPFKRHTQIFQCSGLVVIVIIVLNLIVLQYTVTVIFSFTQIKTSFTNATRILKRIINQICSLVEI